ncbi:hypothetical protein [Neptuniibacter sp. QD37_11]|uniref:hypothetical protein n=1 Tax=Neptuniibacter sp. QD37_11 TaxID=3398209 RepID=UPI0039F5EB79
MSDVVPDSNVDLTEIRALLEAAGLDIQIEELNQPALIALHKTLKLQQHFESMLQEAQHALSALPEKYRSPDRLEVEGKILALLTHLEYTRAKSQSLGQTLH